MSYEGFLDSSIDAEAIKELFGVTLKAALPKSAWDEKIVALRKFRGVSFDSRAEVKPILDGFATAGSDDILSDDPFFGCARYLCGYNAGLRGREGRIARRLRKRKITRAAKKIRSRLRKRRGYKRSDGKGIMLVASSIKKQFLSKRVPRGGHGS